MKIRITNKILAALALLTLPMLTHAANVALKFANDASGTSSFTNSANWSNTAIPSAGNDYYTGTNFMRTPADAFNYTFAGNSLTLQLPALQAVPIRSFLYKGAGGNIYTINNFTNAGGVLDCGSGNVPFTLAGNQFTIASNSTVAADQGPIILNIPLAGTANLTNYGGNLTTYNGNDAAFTGRIVVFNPGTAGLIDFSNQAAIPGNPAASTPDQIQLWAGTTLRDNIGVTFSNANSGITLFGAATINTVNLTTNTIVSEPISGTFALTKTGAGTLTLSGNNNNFSGGLTLASTAGSVLDINSTNALGTGLFTINGGDLNTIDNTTGSALTNLANNAQSWGNNFVFKGSSSLNFGTGAITLAANRIVTNLANTLTLGGNISGAFSLGKQGAGTLALTASNSFTGGLTISAGTVVMGNSNALGTTGMTFGGGTLDMATDGADYTNVVNAGSSTTWTIASDVKTGSVGINHTLGTFLIGSGSPALQMNVVSGPNVASGSPQITASAMILSGGSGGTTIIAPTTATLSIASLTASATSKTLQLDGTNTGNTITGAIVDGGAGAQSITLIKTNISTWTLSGANTFTNSTTVAQGTLALGSGGSLASANISISSGATLDVSASSYALGATQVLSGSGTVKGSFSDSTGSQILPGGSGTVGTLTFNGNLTLAAGDTNKFDFNSASNDLIIVTGNLNPTAGTTINLATLPAGGLTNGNYTLMQVSGTLGGSAANFTVIGKPSPSRQTFAIIYTPGSPNLVQLQVGGSSGTLNWLGGLNGNAWDIVTTMNWSNLVSASKDVYFDGDNVNFTDIGSANPPVLNTNVQPGSVAFSSANAYSLTGNGAINGSAGLTKTGGGTLTISTTNGYTGVTALNGGTVSIAYITNSSTASPIGAATSASANLAFNGGTLQYTGGSASTDHGATLNAGGGTVQVSSAATALAVGGVITGSSGGGLTVSGTGTLVLTGANTYNGNTTVSGGSGLQVGNGGATGNLGSGSTITDNGAITVLRTGTLALTNAITGTGNITNNGTGTVTLSGINTFTGGLTINTGLVQIASSRGIGGTPAAFNPSQINIGIGTLEFSTNINLVDTNSGVTVSAGTIGVDTNITVMISNMVTSATSFTKSLPGTLILSGSNAISTVLNVDTATATASDGILRITSTNVISGVPLIQIRANQGPGSSTLQLDGTTGGIEYDQAFSWSGRNNLVPSVQSIAGNNIWNPNNTTFVAGGTYYMFQCDAGSLTIPAYLPSTAPGTTRTLVFAGNGYTSITGGIQGGGCTNLILLKTNTGALTLWGGNSYTGNTSVQGGTMNAADGSSFGTSIANIEIAPYTNQVATLNISNASVTAQRIVVAGVTANTSTPGTGTVNQVNGYVYASQWVTVGSGGTGGGVGTYNLSGNGSLYVQNTATGTQLEIANFIGSSGTFNLSGSGTLQIQNSAYIAMGANASAGNGTFNQNSGTVTFFSDEGGTVGGSGILYLGKATGLTSNYVYNLDGGTLTVPTVTSASGNSLFYLNGGILQAAKTNSTWVSGLTAAYVSTNGATIDSSFYPVTIPQPLIHDPALGATVDGGLTSQSSGSIGVLMLAGTNTYTGPTVINSGTLDINGSIGAGAVTVTGGVLGGSGTINGTVDVQSGGTLTPGSAIGILNIASSLAFESGSTAQFNFGTGTNSKAIVTGAVNVNGSTTVAINYISAVVAVGTYPLIQYGSLTGFANLTTPTSPNPRFTFSLANNAGTKTISLVVVGNPASLVWHGDGSFNGWDNAGGYQNWFNGGSPDYFYDGDMVLFNNIGSNTPSIYLTTTVSPSAVVVNSTNNYDFAGSGLIAGPGSLVKFGTGTLTLEDNNTYVGATIISNGVVQVGNAGASGTLGSGVISNNASLVLDRSDNTVVMPSPIYGSGTVTMALGDITASGSNYYTGNTLINSGDTYLSNANGLGATNGTITVASGAQLYITGNQDNGGNPLSIIGVGDSNGALRKGGAGTTTYNGAVTMTGNTSISIDTGATLNLPSGLNGAAANANLTLFGAGTGVLTGPLALGSGGLTVTAGAWTLGPSNNFTGLTALNGGTTRITGGSLGNPASFTANQITLGGGTLEAIANATFNDGNAGFTLTANSTLIVDSGATLTISNAISGGNNLTKSSPGTLVLNGSNPFTGTLYVDTASTTASDGITHIISTNALANIPATPGTPTIYQRDNNGGFSTLQLDGTAGNLNLPQEFQISCRNVAVANIENLNGSNILSGNLDIQSGGAAVYFQSDAGTLNISGNIQYLGTLNGTRAYTFTGAGNNVVDGVITAPVNTNAPIDVVMSGTGTLTLANANTYPNTTTVNSGLMLVDGSINSSNGVTVVGGTLGGSGAINDNVTVQSGGTLSPGDSAIGTLTINSNLTLAGTTYIEVNKSALTSDHVVGLTGVTYGGTLFATNLAGTLNVGDSFTVFSTAAHTGNFASVAGTAGTGKAWSFNPTNGVLSVIVGVSQTPTNITALVSGSTLTLSWPADHTGWRLLAQTNTLGTGLNPATNAWFTVPGSASVNSMNITITPGNGTVFYRMVYP